MSRKQIRILLGSWDRDQNRVVESSVLNVCFGKADIEFVRTTRLNDFVRQAGFDGFDLAIVAPAKLLLEPNRGSTTAPEIEVMRAIRELKDQHSTTVFVFGIPASEETAYIDAGASAVFGPFVDREEIESAVDYALHLPEPVERKNPRASFFSALFRGLQRKSAWADE